SKHYGKEKATHTTRCADHSSHRSNTFHEPLRNELENRAVAESHKTQRTEKQRDGGKKRRQDCHDGKNYCDQPEQSQQYANASDFVGDPASHRPHCAAGNDAETCKIPGHDSRNPILIMKEDRHKADQAGEAAESDSVEEAESVGIGFAQK